MPTDVIDSLAKKAGVALDQAEKLWNKAKALATEQEVSPDDDNFYAYVVGVLKNMLSIESIDMLKVWDANIVTEAIISKSSASFLKTRARKIADEIKVMGSKDTEPNWGSIALNFRLFVDEWASSLSANTGLKRLLLGESSNPVRVKREIRNALDDATVVDVYSRIFKDIDREVIKEILSD